MREHAPPMPSRSAPAAVDRLCGRTDDHHVRLVVVERNAVKPGVLGDLPGIVIPVPRPEERLEAAGHECVVDRLDVARRMLVGRVHENSRLAPERERALVADLPPGRREDVAQRGHEIAGWLAAVVELEPNGAPGGFRPETREDRITVAGADGPGLVVRWARGRGRR